VFDHWLQSQAKLRIIITVLEKVITAGENQRSDLATTASISSASREDFA
jgi:hypothetical protein